MRIFSTFHELPLSAIKPEGWADPAITSRQGSISGWWPYEQTGYWVDGMIRCGHLLDDDALVAKAMRQLDAVLDRPDADGYLGPAFMKQPRHWNRWPHAVLFRALMAHHSATGDERIVPALARHFSLRVRIPGWCRQAQLLCNGRPVRQPLRAGSFAAVTRAFAEGDRVTLILPMKIKTRSWPRGGLSVERGPLAYALRVQEDWQRVQDPRSTLEFPAWNLYAASRWNYALALDAVWVHQVAYRRFSACAPGRRTARVRRSR